MPKINELHLSSATAESTGTFADMEQMVQVIPCAQPGDSALMRGLSRAMLPVVLAIFAAPFLILMFYSVPAADDFCLATFSYGGVPQSSVWSITWMYYTKWSPRWVTYLLLSAVTGHVDMASTYGWLLLVVILSNLAAVWYFFRTLFNLSRANSFLIAAIFCAAWVASIANPDEQIYWLTNVVVYNLPLSTMLFLFGLLSKPRRGIWYSTAVTLLSIAVPAQHEIAGTFLFIMLVGGVAFLRIRRRPARHCYLSLAAATVSYCVVMLSPGNAARAAQEHRSLWDLTHLPRWVAHSFYHGMNWLSLPAVLGGAFCIFLLLQRDKLSRNVSGRSPGWLAVTSLCAMFVVLCECSLVEMSTSTWLPPRLISFFQFVFWLFFVCLVLTGAPEVYKIRFSTGTRVAGFALLAVTLLGSDNFRSAVSDLRGPAQSWWRIDRARLSQHGGALDFEAPTQYPRLAKPQMLSGDSGCWVNRCLASYLHAETVIVSHSKDECPH
jgi:hypothetical protein